MLKIYIASIITNELYVIIFLFNILILRQTDYYEMLKIVYSRLHYLIKINFMYISTVLGKGLQYFYK